MFPTVAAPILSSLRTELKFCCVFFTHIATVLKNWVGGLQSLRTQYEPKRN